MTGELVWRTAKTAAVSLAASVSYVWAQIEWPDLNTLGSFGLAAVLAGLVARYTFHQLEGYRSDLKAARDRIDALEDDLHNLGKTKAEADRRIRELETYTHRLRLYVIAQGFGGSDMPQPPEFPA